MAKILDKKLNVYDFQLTNYGKYLMSIGQYAPKYYAFYDDNIVYDNMYTKTGSALTNPISESQNSTHERIKNNTAYMGTLTTFQDVNANNQKLVSNEGVDVIIEDTEGTGASYRFGSGLNYFQSDVTPIRYEPRKDIFRFDGAIGDALLDSKDTDVAPAWKVIVLNGQITSTETKYELAPNLTASVPQINITVDYQKQIRESQYPNRQSDQISPDSLRGRLSRTSDFSDDNFIYLASEDPIVYVDEVNTELLAQNYDVEVFIVTSSVANSPPDLQRKYFETIEEQVVDGLMVRSQPSIGYQGELPQNAVEYYFDFNKDSSADKKIVCRQLQNYNKSSYYIDLDLDCEAELKEDAYYDIYESQVEPEICLD
jgi:hypothetical protein